MYNETDLVRIAKRENNNKRGYLVVNPLQGKHIPVKPGAALGMFEALGVLIGQRYPGQRLLLIGFAETATAIGASIACQLNSFYIQTTREVIPDVNYLFFSEAHSHATEQKLVKDDMDVVMDQIDRIVFIEDEVTTGNTIMNIITLLEASYAKHTEFSVASLLNGMDDEHERAYKGKGIDMLWLVRTRHDGYEAIARRTAGDGRYITAGNSKDRDSYREITGTGYMNARRLVRGADYGDACEGLWRQIRKELDLEKNVKMLVLGTEEFMYPALLIAGRIERAAMDVRFHATTRSPITVSCNPEYPLHTRYELSSVYDRDRRVYIYNLEKYDKVLVVTDAEGNDSIGAGCIMDGLRQRGNTDITYIRWKGQVHR